MRRMVCLTTLGVALAAGYVAPAQAVDVPPIDTTKSGLAYDLGATSMGGLMALGPLRLTSAVYMAMLPGLGNVGGVSAAMAWRVSPRASGGLAWGWGLTGYAVGGLSTRLGELEGYAIYPALIGTLPLGDDVVLRMSGGPLLFTGRSDWMPGEGRARMVGASGFVPFLPNVQVVWRMKDDNELTLGGYPSLVGWRFAL